MTNRLTDQVNYIRNAQQTGNLHQKIQLTVLNNNRENQTSDGRTDKVNNREGAILKKSYRKILL